MKPNLKFTLDQKPSNLKSLAFGLQHILTMLGATIAVPTIICSQLGLSSADTAAFISNVMLTMGISTLLQIKLGSKLPIIQGSSFAFLPPLLLIAIQDYEDPKIALQYMMGAIIIGSLFQIIIGLSGLAGKIQKLLSPVVVGPIIIVIGLSLFPVGTGQASSYWPMAILAMILVFIFSYGKIFQNGSLDSITSFIGSVPVLGSVVICCILSLILGYSGVFDGKHPAIIDISQELKLLPDRVPLFSWGVPQFNISFLVIMIVAYLVSIFESIGDYNAVAEITQDEQNTIDKLVNSRRINKGVLTEGIGCFIAGIIGANPTTSYSENIGLIGVTKIASRYVIVIASLILIIVGFLPFFGTILSSIPTPIMGGLYCVLFGMVTGVGIRITSKANTQNMRNITIIGFTLFMAFCIPEYFNKAEVKEIILNDYGKSTLDLVSGVLGSNMAVATIIGLLLDNLIPKTSK